MKALPQERCETCGAIRSGWYDDRDRHMVEEFRAGENTTRIALAYGLSQRRVQEIIRDRLGMEVMMRIARTHMRNEEEE